MNVLEVRDQGLYCKPGNFYIDAWAPVSLSIITHAHSDHARFGHKHYIATKNTADIFRRRIGTDCPVETWDYEKKVKVGNCWVSLHPAGHILGSAQIRIETQNKVCVISGDYKRAPDPTCEPFSLIECDIFVTESTFGLPIYQWEEAETTVKNILEWWRANKAKGLASVLFCYALGKAERLLALLQNSLDQPIYVHGAFCLSLIFTAKKGYLWHLICPSKIKREGAILET